MIFRAIFKKIKAKTTLLVQQPTFVFCNKHILLWSSDRLSHSDKLSQHTKKSQAHIATFGVLGVVRGKI